MWGSLGRRAQPKSSFRPQPHSQWRRAGPTPGRRSGGRLGLGLEPRSGEGGACAGVGKSWRRRRRLRREPHLGKAGVPSTFVRACVLREGTRFSWGLKDLSLQAKASTSCQVSSPLIFYESAQHPVQTTSPGASQQAQLWAVWGPRPVLWASPQTSLLRRFSSFPSESSAWSSDELSRIAVALTARETGNHKTPCWVTGLERIIHLKRTLEREPLTDMTDSRY